jgi:hypothetical protein
MGAMRLYTCPFPRTYISNQAGSRHSEGPAAQVYLEHLSNSHASISFQLLLQLADTVSDHSRLKPQ